ncbi:MAG TPA: heavy-metal-associated domain-containing protein [Verrucomicrobiae bacterium]|jgi:copper chaperone CopZ
MKHSLIALFSIAALSASALAAEKKEFVPHPVTATFFISGVECGNCVDAITESVKKVKSVTAVKMDSATGYANISFDTHVSSYHQIAQAIADAPPQHANKYAASLKVKVPDYAKGDNAKKIDAIFAKSATQVRMEATDAAKGDFTLHFLPLAVDAKKEGPQGWNAGKFGHPIGDPAPNGLGLKFLQVKEGQAAAPKAAPKKK